jgi:hypothetical protein
MCLQCLCLVEHKLGISQINIHLYAMAACGQQNKKLLNTWWHLQWEILSTLSRISCTPQFFITFIRNIARYSRKYNTFFLSFTVWKIKYLLSRSLNTLQLYMDSDIPFCGELQLTRRHKPSLKTSKKPGFSLAISLWTVSTRLAE